MSILGYTTCYGYGEWNGTKLTVLDSSWNVMAHDDAREGKWRGNRRMEWVACTLHTTSEHGVSSITTTDAHTSAASSRLNWRPRWFKWTRSFRRKTKSGFCACAITFQLTSTMITNYDKMLRTIAYFWVNTPSLARTGCGRSRNICENICTEFRTRYVQKAGYEWNTMWLLDY